MVILSPLLVFLENGEETRNRMKTFMVPDDRGSLNRLKFHRVSFSAFYGCCLVPKKYWCWWQLI